MIIIPILDPLYSCYGSYTYFWDIITVYKNGQWSINMKQKCKVSWVAKKPTIQTLTCRKPSIPSARNIDCHEFLLQQGLMTIYVSCCYAWVHLHLCNSDGGSHRGFKPVAWNKNMMMAMNLTTFSWWLIIIVQSEEGKTIWEKSLVTTSQVAVVNVSTRSPYI